MVRFTKAAGPREKEQPRRFFYALLVGEAYQIWEPRAWPTGCAEDEDRGLPLYIRLLIRAGILRGSGFSGLKAGICRVNKQCWNCTLSRRYGPMDRVACDIGALCRDESTA